MAGKLCLVLAAVTTILAVTGASLDVSLPRLLKITVDGNLVDVCVDGQRVVQSDLPNHNRVELVDTILIPNTASVLAVKANDGNPNFVGLVAADSTGSFVSNTSWRCHVNARPDEDWCSKNFDDSAWARAVLVANYGADGRGEIAGSFPQGAKWIWTSATPSNDGIVYCRAGIPAADGSSGSGGSGGSGGSSVSAPVIVSGSEKTLTRIVGEPATVYAIATGPAEQSDWSKDGVVVSADPAIHISAVTVVDAGRYESTFSNTAGSATQSTTLDVLVPPALSGSTSESHSASVGDALSFGNVAVIAGTPTPTVTWYKDGVLVSTGAPSTAGADSSGTYTVIAENVAGTAVHYVTVDVAAGPLVIGPNSPADVTRHSGTSVTLFCVVYGGDRCDKPTVSWTKNGAAFSANDGGVVFIQSASAADAGIYTCTFTDKASRTASKTITLTIIDAPVVSAPVLEELVVRGGSDLCLTCPLARGTDPVSQTWYKDGQVMASDATCLSPVDYTDVATFTCLRSNALGDDVKISSVSTSVQLYKTYRTSFTDTAVSNLAATGQLVFQVKAIGSVVLGLTPAQGVYSNDNVYVITLAANNNNAITLSKTVTGKNPRVLATANVSGGVLSDTELRWFWVSVSGGVVSVGRGPAAGQQVQLTYTDSAPVAVNFLGVASGAGGASVLLVYP